MMKLLLLPTLAVMVLLAADVCIIAVAQHVYIVVVAAVIISCCRTDSLFLRGDAKIKRADCWIVGLLKVGFLLLLYNTIWFS